MIELLATMYRSLKLWKIPTKADGITIEPSCLARLIWRDAE